MLINLNNFNTTQDLKNSCVSVHINKQKINKYNRIDKLYTYYLVPILLELGLSLPMGTGAQLPFIFIASMFS